MSFTRTHKLSRKLSIEITLGDGRLDVVWAPDIPKRPLSRKEMKRYRLARNEAIAEMMRLRGIQGAMVVEI